MSDRFRRQYVELSSTNKIVIDVIKGSAGSLAQLLEGEQSRELSIALTKLEECVFWATKHYSAPEHQVPRE